MSIRATLVFLATLCAITTSPTVAAGGAVVVDGSGTLLGTFMGSTQSGLVDVLSERGYAATLVSTMPTYFGGEPWGPTFDGASCAGPAFSTWSIRGMVTRDRQMQVWYVPQGASPTSRPSGTVLSLFSSLGACSSYTTTADSMLIPAFPNDSAVTGILTAHVRPITILPLVVYLNGFEADKVGSMPRREAADAGK